MEIVLEARDLSFRLDGREIFQGLNFRLRRGEIYALLGASVLMATSEWLSAFSIADRVGFLDHGRIVAEGTAPEMLAKLEKIQRSGSPHERVAEAEKLILGLQNHWLLRGSMPKVPRDTSLAVSQRESPYDKGGKTSR